MMKAKVLKKFRDKNTRKIYKTGTVIEVTKERFDEIQKTDKTLIEAYDETAEKKADETAEKKTAKKAKAE